MVQARKKPVISFDQYLKRRGYLFFSMHQVLFRTIKKSFSQKSFCGFWRMWNPFTGYLVFLLYSYLGGNRKRPYAIAIVFLTSGVVFHDLVIYLISGSISIVFTITFLIYSMISITETLLFTKRKHIRAHHPAPPFERSLTLRVMLNMALLATPLILGFFINFLIFPKSVMNRLFQFFLI